MLLLLRLMRYCQLLSLPTWFSQWNTSVIQNDIKLTLSPHFVWFLTQNNTFTHFRTSNPPNWLLCFGDKSMTRRRTFLLKKPTLYMHTQSMTDWLCFSSLPIHHRHLSSLSSVCLLLSTCNFHLLYLFCCLEGGLNHERKEFKRNCRRRTATCW